MRWTVRSLIALVCVWAGTAAPAAAQQDSLVPGERIRLTFAQGSGSRATGRLTGLQNGVLAFEPDAMSHYYGSSNVLISELKGLERSVGQRNNGVTGLLVGGATGIVIGGFVGYLGDGDCGASELCDDIVHHGVRVPLLVYGGLIGAVVGGAIGAATRTDEWRAVALPGPSANFIEVSGPGWAPSVSGSLVLLRIRTR